MSKRSKPYKKQSNLLHNIRLGIEVAKQDQDLLWKHQFCFDSNGKVFTLILDKKVFLNTLVRVLMIDGNYRVAPKFSPASNLAHNLLLGIQVDLQDQDLLSTHKFHITGGYARTYIDLKPVMLHQLVVSRMIGRPLTDDDSVRHVDPNGIECRRSNLRVKTGGKL